MSHELPDAVPLVVRQVEQQPPLIAELQQPADVTPATLTPEQAQAVEAAFTQSDQESHTVAGLLGMWTGTLLLHDLMQEHFSEPAGEVEAEQKKPRKKDQDPTE